MIVYRIATETRQHAADDLSGNGAANAPGRWNDAGQPVLYTAPSRALAVLETAAHVHAQGLPLNKYLVEIELDPGAWRGRTCIKPADLPVGWDAIPAGRASVQLGSNWFMAARSAVLEVPSVIVPEESAVVINPNHPDARSIQARKIRVFAYDRLFRV